jgi:pimeloyl-ACP methyl ester carboxylesterase
MEFHDLYFDSDDGLKLYARDYPGPSSSAPTVLCWHGLSRNSADFGLLAPILAQHFRVIVSDQRGRGRSEYDAQARRYNIPTYLADMGSLLRVAAVDTFSIVGSSMGGMMALGMHALLPERVERIVLNDIGPELGVAGIARIQSYVGKTPHFQSWEAAAEFIASINAAAFPGLKPSQWMSAAKNMFAERGGVIVPDYDPLISAAMAELAASDTSAQLWQLFEATARIPVMLVRGANSDLLEPELVKAMQARRPGLQVLEVPNVGHTPSLTEPGVAEQVLAFLTGTP